jgi:arylsulfatase A-like enzyme
MTQRPNILLITADQWRGECLGALGHIVKTPHLDALAEEATTFTRHHAACAPCSPARASLYTGQYQMNTRVVRNGTPLDARFDNIAKAARRGGYVPTLFGYTDTSPDPRGMEPTDPALQSYEGVLPGMEVGQILPEDDGPWNRALRTSCRCVR